MSKEGPVFGSAGVSLGAINMLVDGVCCSFSFNSVPCRDSFSFVTKPLLRDVGGVAGEATPDPSGEVSIEVETEVQDCGELAFGFALVIVDIASPGREP